MSKKKPVAPDPDNTGVYEGLATLETEESSVAAISAVTDEESAPVAQAQKPTTGIEAETLVFILKTALRKGGKRLAAGTEIHLTMAQAAALPAYAIRRKV